MKTILLIAISLLAGVVTAFGDEVDDQIRDALGSPKTHWYDEPRVFQVGDTMFQLGASPAPTLPGNPNNHGVWNRPGGCIDAPADDFKFVRGIHAPRRAVVYSETNRVAPGRALRSPTVVRWTWPAGTVRMIKLMDGGGRHFETHAMVKVDDDHDGQWETRRLKIAAPPSWFVDEDKRFSVDDCMKCHRDAGKHASLLDASRRQYYGNVSGSDGAFAPDPRRIVDGDRYIWDDRGLFDLSNLSSD